MNKTDLFHLRQAELISRTSELLDMVTNYPIVFHKTTPKTFQCIRDCGGCCIQGFYFDEEFKKVPQKYKSGIEDLNPAMTHQLKTCNGKCIFSKLDGCQIHGHHPMRCQIYPYKFIVDESKKCIVIFSESFFEDTWVSYDPGMGPALCPGYLQKISVEEKILGQVRPFLSQIVLEKPVFLPFNFYWNTDDLFDNKSFNLYFSTLKRLGGIPYPNRQGKWVLNGREVRMKGNYESK